MATGVQLRRRPRHRNLPVQRWNVFTHGATGKHGITQEQDNPITIDYMRQSVRQTLLNYPQIAGIGVTAGENADRTIEGEFSKENSMTEASSGRTSWAYRSMNPDGVVVRCE